MKMQSSSEDPAVKSHGIKNLTSVVMCLCLLVSTALISWVLGKQVGERAVLASLADVCMVDISTSLDRLVRLRHGDIALVTQMEEVNLMMSLSCFLDAIQEGGTIDDERKQRTIRGVSEYCEGYDVFRASNLVQPPYRSGKKSLEILKGKGLN